MLLAVKSNVSAYEIYQTCGYLLAFKSFESKNTKQVRVMPPSQPFKISPYSLHPKISTHPWESVSCPSRHHTLEELPHGFNIPLRLEHAIIKYG